MKSTMLHQENSADNSILLTHETNENIQNKSSQNYVKELLKSRIFLGRYLERRLVNDLKLYRDIVLVSAAEVELNRDLIEARQKLKSVDRNLWIGFTDTELLDFNSSGVCIWTEIDNEPFGPFWFQIKSVLFRKDEILLKLKCIRHISESFLELEPILTGGGIARGSGITDLNNTLLFDKSLLLSLKEALTLSNLKELATFFVAFVIAVFTGSTTFVTFIGNFILAFIRETSYFVKSSTPLFLGFLDFFSKIVGGFYILLAMIFKPNPTPARNRDSNYRAIDYNNKYDRYID